MRPMRGVRCEAPVLQKSPIGNRLWGWCDGRGTFHMQLSLGFRRTSPDAFGRTLGFGEKAEPLIEQTADDHVELFRTSVKFCGRLSRFAGAARRLVRRPRAPRPDLVLRERQVVVEDASVERSVVVMVTDRADQDTVAVGERDAARGPAALHCPPQVALHAAPSARRGPPERRGGPTVREAGCRRRDRSLHIGSRFNAGRRAGFRLARAKASDTDATGRTCEGLRDLEAVVDGARSLRPRKFATLYIVVLSISNPHMQGSMMPKSVPRRRLLLASPSVPCYCARVGSRVA